MAPVDTVALAMGSTARFFLVGGPPELEPMLRARLAQLEQRWSRFLPASEVSRANNAQGETVTVSPDTVLLVRRAKSASARTRGWFDPTRLNELEAAGYDLTFDCLEDALPDALVATVDRRSPDQHVVVHDWSARCRLMVVNTEASTLSIPPCFRFDPGGLGKGLAADLLLAEALNAGASSAMVDLGGDIVFGGTEPSGGWAVNVENPFDQTKALATIHVPWGAVATSSRAKRRWRVDETEQHHLIDPGTGRPSRSDVIAATVIAGRCWLAESFAKAAVLAGTELGIELLESNGLEGLLVDSSGLVHPTADMGALVGTAAA